MSTFHLLHTEEDNESLLLELAGIGAKPPRRGYFAAKIYLDVTAVEAMCSEIITFSPMIRIPQLACDQAIIGVAMQGGLTSGYAFGLTNRLECEEKPWFGTDLSALIDFLHFIEYVNCGLLTAKEIVIIARSALAKLN